MGREVQTVWRCESCRGRVVIGGSIDGDPDEPGWFRIDLSTGYGSMERYGVGSSVYQERENSALVCSEGCGAAYLNKVVHRWGWSDRKPVGSPDA